VKDLVHLVRLVATLSFVAAVSADGRAEAARIRTDHASGFYVAFVTIPASTAVSFETTGCIPTATNPALHLLRINSPTSVTQVGFNDDFPRDRAQRQNFVY